MNHNALEAQMEAIMNEAHRNTSPEKSAPARAISKRWIAALMLAAALFGSLMTGLIHNKASGPPAASDMIESAGGEPKIDVFFLGVGRYRK